MILLGQDSGELGIALPSNGPSHAGTDYINFLCINLLHGPYGVQATKKRTKIIFL